MPISLRSLLTLVLLTAIPAASSAMDSETVRPANKETLDHTVRWAHPSSEWAAGSRCIEQIPLNRFKNLLPIYTPTQVRSDGMAVKVINGQEMQLVANAKTMELYYMPTNIMADENTVFLINENGTLTRTQKRDAWGYGEAAFIVDLQDFRAIDALGECIKDLLQTKGSQSRYILNLSPLSDGAQTTCYTLTVAKDNTVVATKKRSMGSFKSEISLNKLLLCLWKGFSRDLAEGRVNLIHIRPTKASCCWHKRYAETDHAESLAAALTGAGYSIPRTEIAPIDYSTTGDLPSAQATTRLVEEDKVDAHIPGRKSVLKHPVAPGTIMGIKS